MDSAHQIVKMYVLVNDLILAECACLYNDFVIMCTSGIFLENKLSKCKSRFSKIQSGAILQLTVEYSC